MICHKCFEEIALIDNVWYMTKQIYGPGDYCEAALDNEDSPPGIHNEDRYRWHAPMGSQQIANTILEAIKQ